MSSVRVRFAERRVQMPFSHDDKSATSFAGRHFPEQTGHAFPKITSVGWRQWGERLALAPMDRRHPR